MCWIFNYYMYSLSCSTKKYYKYYFTLQNYVVIIFNSSILRTFSNIGILSNNILWSKIKQWAKWQITESYNSVLCQKSVLFMLEWTIYLDTPSNYWGTSYSVENFLFPKWVAFLWTMCYLYYFLNRLRTVLD